MRGAVVTGLVHGTFGLVLLTLPRQMVAAVSPGDADTDADAHDRAVTVTRVLGARHLVQALVTSLVPQRRVVAAGLLVQVLHVVSMLALAAVRPQARRLALADAAVETALGALAAVQVSSHGTSSR